MSPALTRNDPWVERFTTLERTRSQEPAWLQSCRQTAIDRFAELGLPTTRHEAWKYTNVAAIAKETFALAPADAPVAAEDLESLRVPDLDAHEVVIVDGRFRSDLAPASSTALPDGVVVGSLASALTNGDLESWLEQHPDREDLAFAALNTAFFQDGVFIRVPKNVVLDRPVHVQHWRTADDRALLATPRLVVVAESGSQLELIETYGGSGESQLTDAVSEIFVGANASVQHVKLQVESSRAWHVAAILARLERDARYASHSISLGAAIARNDIRVRFEAEGGDTTLNGLFFATGEQLVDHHTVVDHRVPHCTSRELYKGILDERGHGVFDGKVWVREQAQKTDSSQTNRNLILSRDAIIDTKPQLEIYADDVRCAHGATIGQLDADALYYLRSRGIAEAKARSLLMRGFATDVLTAIASEPLRAALERRLLERLPGALDLEGDQ